MPEGRVTTRNRVPGLRKKWERNKHKKLKGLALTGAALCKKTIDDGTSGIQSDTGSLAASFYIEHATFHGYEPAVSRMLNEYVGRYSVQHGEGRIAPPITVGPNQAAFASASAIMAFWEHGHQNRWTGNFEKAPVLRPVREELKMIAARRFKGLLKGS